MERRKRLSEPGRRELCGSGWFEKCGGLLVKGRSQIEETSEEGINILIPFFFVLWFPVRLPNLKNEGLWSIALIHRDQLILEAQRERYLVESEYCGSVHTHKILPTVFSPVLLIPGTACYEWRTFTFWSVEKNVSFEYL